jgi:lipoprotein-anchoring transpeptidase ErfK/SrfK
MLYGLRAKRWGRLIRIVGSSALLYAVMYKLGFVMSPSALPAVLCIPSCPPTQRYHAIAPEPLPETRTDERSLSEIIGNADPTQLSLLVEKSQYRLTVVYAGHPVKAYPIVLGGNPTGDKLFEGDERTPEGIYRIRDLYPHPDWSKFIWLDYPSPQAWREHFAAKWNGELSWFLPIGGQIGIHGVPEGGDGLIADRTNWTWGCISLTNADVHDLYAVLEPGMLVEIVP